MNATETKTSEQATERNGQKTGKPEKRGRRSYEWVPEVLALAIVTPALIHGIASLQNLPIA